MATLSEYNVVEREFEVFARLVVGHAPPPALAARYADGVAKLFAGGDESPALRAARRGPTAAGLLDAGCALLRRDDPLRHRLLLATAVMEATPEFTGQTLPRSPTLSRLLAETLWHGGMAGAKMIAGAVYLLWVECRP